MDLPLPEDKLSAIREALFRGQKIEAIKLHRTATGAELVVAKKAVEELEATLRAATPERFGSVETRRGCFAVLAGVTLLVGVTLWKLSA
jgi:hypothetical protein